MEQVARQLLRAIRGGRSQVALSRRLRYRSNPVADWEAGRRFPTAAETLRACTVVGIDIDAAFERFDAPTAGIVGPTDEAVAAWLDALRESTTIRTLAQRTGASRHAVSRWLSGGARPRLPDFLRLVDAITNRVSELVGELVPIERVPLLVQDHRRRRAAQRLAFDDPWTAMVLRVLETRLYQGCPTHQPGLIAELLGLSLAEETRCIEALVACGVIERRKGRYVPITELSVSTRADPTSLRALGSHWSEVALERQRAPRRPGDLFSYNLFSVSKADLERIRELHRAYFHEVRGIVAASVPAETVALINVQMVEWSGDS